MIALTLKRKWTRHFVAVYERFAPDTLPAGVQIEQLTQFLKAGQIGQAGQCLYDAAGFAAVDPQLGAGPTDKKLVVSALDTDAGVRAAVFLAQGMGAICLRLAQHPDSHLHADRYVEAAALLDKFFPLPADGRARVDELAGGVSPDGAGLDDAQIAFLSDALRIGLGEAVVSQLQVFRPGTGADYYLLQTLGERIWSNGNRQYLETVDPGALATWEYTIRPQAAPDGSVSGRWTPPN